MRIVKVIFASFLLLTSACSPMKPVIHVPKYPPIAPPIEKVDVALVLGGGGSKGMAHIGVLKVFEEHGIPIDLIVGCSVGSAIGALYADEPNADALRDKLSNIKKWDLLDASIGDSLQMLVALKGPIRGYYYEKFLDTKLAENNIEDLKIPFIAVTTDIYSNTLYAIRSGPIVPAVHASSAVPPIFTPVHMYGKLLVDGGVKAPMPVNVAKQYQPKVIIAVDISAPPPREELGNMFDLTYRAFWIFYYELSREQARDADVIIHPDMHGHGTFEDGCNDELYKSGMSAANKRIEEIKDKLKKLGIPLKKKNSEI